MATTDNRAHYLKNLSDLKDSLLDLASMVDKAMHLSIFVMKSRDHRQAERIILADSKINAKRYELEDEALAMLATQQPVLSRDLRLVAAVMHIAGELERMGDYAKGLARISEMMAGIPPTSSLVTIDKMMQISRDMLNQALDAFVRGDVELARKVIARDDEVDVLYNQAYKELLALMLNDNQVVDLATMLLWAIHNVERLGDRVTNICERIVFVETGQVTAGSPHLHAD
jgi:phosphate transport system protein